MLIARWGKKSSFFMVYLSIFLISLVMPECIQAQEHNCDMLGIVYNNAKQITWRPVIKEMLESLENDCGTPGTNPHGWGIGFYCIPAANQIVSLSRSLMPVVYRGRPAASADHFRYDKAVEYLCSSMTGGGIAHVRRGTTFLTGIPNPHPFLRHALESEELVRKNFSVLLAHNGTIPVFVLRSLIDPGYLEKNPEDYVNNGSYHDSDHYSIYMIQMIESLTISGATIREAIIYAVTLLADTLQSRGYSRQLNFVMTDGKTLWALCYTTAGHTLYYAPSNPDCDCISDIWMAASECLGTSQSWYTIPNYCLMEFVPGKNPVSYYFRSDIMPDSGLLYKP
ncbi:MAG: class II glutamine amidotransferase [Spirochaetales bacterium]|nr:class II glutamine amidotransferase [Spirochaetales bacterium]